MFKIYKEKYVVYDNGDVYIIGTKEVRKLKPWVTNSGYKQVNINRKAEYLHRVIIEAFRGKSDMQVDHIDGNKNNNTLKKLTILDTARKRSKISRL
ncbi:HNH endonuclease [Lactococcus phage 96401]|uniref:HNH endonuclease n=1 Tax=Lactococcus phage 96401 TaxID=2029674 RepID=A0A343JQW9_9CAUD|nr:HNH endonuclease [Lactococcus phage 96401]ASZ71892.1 HNH endonuclease [Lactococcus phage 96401]